MRAHVHQADAVWVEHDEHHADAEDHGWHENQEQAEALEAQVHEVRHDQRGFDERQAEQDRDHDVDFDAFVSQEHLDCRQQQQPHPNPREQLRAAYRVIIDCFRPHVRWFAHRVARSSAAVY